MVFVMMCEKLVKYSILRPWYDAPWIPLRPLSLPFAMYFTNSAPVLANMFNRTYVAKSFDTHEHFGWIMSEKAGG